MVLIVDGLCYSAADMFAAGFIDHDLGRVIGVHENTGAGGANVWSHRNLSRLKDPENSRLKALPAGATPLDFAFSVHTEVGLTCVGAKVNNKMVKFEYELKSGDICTILTRKGSRPKKDWLNVVKTARARSKIRHYFRTKSVRA